jgi:hypothetical protein
MAQLVAALVVNTSVPYVVHVAPPSVLRSTPHPAVLSLGSPVPTYTIFGFTGSTTIEPVTSEHSLSVSGTQLAP